MKEELYFYIDKSNKLAFKTINTLIEERKEYSLITIYGESGVGKTQLINKLSNKENVLKISSEKITNELIDSLKNNVNDEFYNKYTQANILIIENFEFFKFKKRLQEDIFHVIRSYIENNKIIILTFTVEKAETFMIGINDNIVSKIKSGIVIQIKNPTKKIKNKIIRDFNKQNKLKINTSTKRLIKKCKNVPQLLGILKKENILKNIRKTIK